MSDRPIFNADRKHAMREVERALKDGRIDFEDYDELTSAIAQAPDHATLEHIVRRSRELSTTGSPAEPRRAAPVEQRPGGQLHALSAENASSFGGDVRREGRWTVIDGSRYTSTLGNVFLDMRSATASVPEVTLTTTAYLGNVSVIVSPGVAVINRINTILGEVKDKLEPPVPGGARITLTGTCLMGHVKLLSLPPEARVPFAFKHL